MIEIGSSCYRLEENFPNAGQGGDGQGSVEKCSLEDFHWSDWMSSFKDNHVQPNPHYSNLVRIDWAVAGGLSWRDSSCRRCTFDGASLRQKDFHRLIGWTCSRLRLRDKKLGIYFKSEYEKGEGHAHFLIASRGVQSMGSHALSQTLEHLWTNVLIPIGFQTAGMGTAKVRPFNATQQEEAVSYVCKREFDQWGSELDTFEHFSTALEKMILEKNCPTPFAKQGWSEFDTL